MSQIELGDRTPDSAAGLRLLRRKTVEQAIAAGGDQIGLRAAAGHVRRVPGLLECGIGDALPVMVADERAAEGAARPIATGHVNVPRKCPAVHLRAGQHVVHVGRVAAALDDFALLRQRRLLIDLVVGAMQVVDVLRDE